MTSILLTVTGAKARATVSGPLTSGMVGIPVTIEYDDAWNGLTKNLVCRCSQWGPDRGETRTILGIGETATVAHEVMKADMNLYLGVEGYSEDGKLVMPTTWAQCGKIQHGANASADPSTDTKLPLLAQINQIKQYAKLPLNEDGTPNYGAAGYYAVSDGAGGITWVAAGNAGGDTGNKTHGVIWDLVNVTSSNNAASVTDGASFTAVLTPAEGYKLGDVTVTMGGEVLTGVWNADTATVTITSVTGDLVISCAAITAAVTDTSPVIAQTGVGWNADKGQTAYAGLCITKTYAFEPNLAEIKASSYYDAENDYFTKRGMAGAVKYHVTNTEHIAAGGSVSGSTQSYKLVFLRDGVAVQAVSISTSTTEDAPGKATIQYKDTDAMYANGVSMTLWEADVENAFAYWATENDGYLPIGVRSGDIIFAGKNTKYYGLVNIDGTMAGEEVSETLSFDDDIAQNYAVATASILGEDTATDTETAYGVSSELAAVIDEVRTAWMTEYGGDYRKIPIIISTDQHGRRNSGIFNMIGRAFSMHDISKVMNLGDTLATDWYDADEAHPLLSNAELEAWCKSVKAIPFSKQLNVFGNHDCCYGNYADEGNPIGTRYPDSKAHLYQYFRNIYARRTNNNGWFSVKDDAFNVKYVVYSLYQWPNGLDSSNAIHTEQMDWFIKELKADDGYDIVIVAHEPFNLNCTTANYPTNGTLQDMTWQRGLALEAVIDARRNRTSGTTTDGSGVAHTFDFSGCTSELLCSLHGHTHEDQYAHTPGGVLQNAFDWFANNTFFMALIDRVNRQLNIWKVEGDALTYQNYQVSLEKPVEAATE